jgi:MarR-like DNA-binding transcriptional regulator SgrR of sgrS sRNA
LLMLCPLWAVARTRPHYGGTLRVETEGDPWQRPYGIARRLVYDGLTTLDGQGTVQPALATGWEADSGNHRWQFRLRPGVRFHDGSPLTSTAVVASLNLSCNGNCPWTNVRAVGSSVVFIGDAPMPNLPALLAGDEFLILFVGSAEGPATQSNIGTGPYRLTSSSNGVLTLKANDSCWQGRPFADVVEIRSHRTVHDQWLDLSLDRTDLVEVPVEMIRLAQQLKLRLSVAPHVELLALKVADIGALANPMVRGAIAASLDRSSIANVIFQKQGEATASVLPSSLSGFAFLFPVDRDLNKAHALRGGLTVPTFVLGADGDATMQLAAQRIALNLHEAGLNATVATPGSGQRADLTLRRLPLESGEPSAVFDAVLRSAGEPTVAADPNPAALYKAERTFLDQHTLIPLIDLPRAYALGTRMRELLLTADGVPDLANASLGDAQ